MGISKTEKFTKEQNMIATLAKALAHPARIAILEYLFDTKSCVCGDIVEEIGLAQATISQHLKELKNIGLIKGSIDGTRVCYCIDDSNWEQMELILNKFISTKKPHKNQCC
ncbi:ArsR/SmtB family transcription factor [Wenyingzhuangia marina]|uniref:Transcriptional regulator, ArsR family n=1 Tax=Wenyingzhuangia marina TaxID=1195760 RepID=A0A1M5VZJ9_9FLAO|nr:metalloregulator ArsR/SmtB family transcription factor [Wenyingzhuangia marina]GGF76842.1 transcriptional regulator [Wenyingzhuangia marina]SHH80702.1 transcriptional regulator, ArsR family [Wenyingzhuangia marina]